MSRCSAETASPCHNTYSSKTVHVRKPAFWLCLDRALPEPAVALHSTCFMSFSKQDTLLRPHPKGRPGPHLSSTITASQSTSAEGLTPMPTCEDEQEISKRCHWKTTVGTCTIGLTDITTACGAQPGSVADICTSCCCLQCP